MGVWRLRRLGVPVDKFAEASSIPCAFTLAVGRLGCFAAGCCRGLPTHSLIGVSFPDNPGLPLWPSQLFESAAALLTGIALLIADRYCRRASTEHAVLFPIFLIAYGGYRFAFDFLREGRRIFGLMTGQYAGIIAVAAGICWLAGSMKRRRAAEIS